MKRVLCVFLMVLLLVQMLCVCAGAEVYTGRAIDVEAVVKAAIAENPKAVEDFKNGKEKALMSLFGRCMKELKGNCAPDTLKEILIATINSL